MNQQTAAAPTGDVANNRGGPSANKLGQLACMLEQRPQLRGMIRQLTDQETTCVCQAVVVLATAQEVCTSTVALDLRIWQLASELGGRAVSLVRVRQVRRAVQRNGGLAIEVSGVQVLPVGSAGSAAMTVPWMSREPAGTVDGQAGGVGGEVGCRVRQRPGSDGRDPVRDVGDLGDVGAVGAVGDGADIGDVADDGEGER